MKKVKFLFFILGISATICLGNSKQTAINNSTERYDLTFCGIWILGDKLVMGARCLEPSPSGPCNRATDCYLLEEPNTSN